LKVPTRIVPELGLSLVLRLNASRTRRLLDRASPVVLELVSPVLILRAVVFDPSWFRVMVTWLTPGSDTAATLSVDPDVAAEPAEMLAAQQTETRPTAAVAATKR
jgi:hypothetical protein